MSSKPPYTYSPHLLNTSPGRDKSQGWDKIENLWQDNSQGWEEEKKNKGRIITKGVKKKKQGQDNNQEWEEVKNQGWDML